MRAVGSILLSQPLLLSSLLHDKLLEHPLSNLFHTNHHRHKDKNHWFMANVDLFLISTFTSQIHREKKKVKRNESEKCILPNWRQQCYCFQSALISIVQSRCFLVVKLLCSAPFQTCPM